MEALRSRLSQPPEVPRSWLLPGEGSEHAHGNGLLRACDPGGLGGPGGQGLCPIELCVLGALHSACTRESAQEMLVTTSLTSLSQQEGGAKL